MRKVKVSFKKKDETKRVPQAQEIDYSREITTKKELLEAQTNTSRSASSSSFISFLFQDHSFSDRIFKTKNSVFFLETRYAGFPTSRNSIPTYMQAFRQAGIASHLRFTLCGQQKQHANTYSGFPTSRNSIPTYMHTAYNTLL